MALILNIAREVISVAVFKLDPPPATNDISELRSYIYDLYEQLSFVLGNIDTNNMSDDFLSTINQNNQNGSDS